MEIKIFRLNLHYVCYVFCPPLLSLLTDKGNTRCFQILIHHKCLFVKPWSRGKHKGVSEISYRCVMGNGAILSHFHGKMHQNYGVLLNSFDLYVSVYWNKHVLLLIAWFQNLPITCGQGTEFPHMFESYCRIVTCFIELNTSDPTLVETLPQLLAKIRLYWFW